MVKKFFAKGYIALVLAFMYIPIFVLIFFSFTDTRNIGAWNGFTFKLYIDLFKNKEIMTAVLNTFLVAIVSATVSTFLGTLGAIGVFYGGKKFRRAMESATQLPVVNAEIVMALSLVVLFVALGFKFSFFTLVIGHVVLTIAFVYLSVKPKLIQMDPSIYEAALDLGATPNYALTHVVLPEIIPGIISGFALSMTLSLDDYIITAFLRNNSFNTLSTYVQGVIARSSIPPALRALTTLIFVVALIALVVNNFRVSHAKKVIRPFRKGDEK